MLDPGELALLNGVEGREAFEPVAAPALLPAGAGADERTTSIKRWICKESASNDGCAGSALDIRSLVYRGADDCAGNSGVRADTRLLKKPSKDEGAKDCLDSRAQPEEDDDP